MHRGLVRDGRADVAQDAGVALGTLYRRFRSKEDLLIAALAVETGNLEKRFAQRGVRGADVTQVSYVGDKVVQVAEGALSESQGAPRQGPAGGVKRHLEPWTRVTGRTFPRPPAHGGGRVVRRESPATPPPAFKRTKGR